MSTALRSPQSAGAGRPRPGRAPDAPGRPLQAAPPALQTRTYEPYLDGYGFRAVAEAQISGLSGGFRASQPRVISALEAAAAQLERAFPTATSPGAEALAPAQDLAVANARLQLAVSGMR